MIPVGNACGSDWYSDGSPSVRVEKQKVSFAILKCRGCRFRGVINRSLEGKTITKPSVKNSYAFPTSEDGGYLTGESER